KKGCLFRRQAINRPPLRGLKKAPRQRWVPFALTALFACNLLCPAETIQCDVCIYGGTVAGVAAGVQAARMGKSAIIAEFGNHVGGMTSGGLGATDIGNKAAIGGI